VEAPEHNGNCGKKNPEVWHGHEQTKKYQKRKTKENILKL
jgi:hypothetical protein